MAVLGAIRPSKVPPGPGISFAIVEEERKPKPTASKAPQRPSLNPQASPL
jgi:hypothetical protein